ncbi:helix-turn-helix domain-containing protein [Nitrosomonas supralitoralis]|uniref:helix-turn-helix domain-containing protein n=1 Tax=Nitrosomonas supralitoralis TaxID=2116706 RepID=UPI0026BC1F58
MTQELITNILGVRREEVTKVAGNLQQSGLIHYQRGHITVLVDPDWKRVFVNVIR